VVAKNNIAILGGAPGTLYGVHTFLEDYLGVRFLKADITHVPHADAKAQELSREMLKKEPKLMK